MQSLEARGAAIGAVTDAATGGLIGAAIMVFGAAIISIAGVRAVAGFARQADDRVRYRIDIAGELAIHLS